MKKHTKLLLTAGVCVAAVCAICFSAHCYYGSRFRIGTFINGIYCTGKSTEQVNGELSAGYGAETLILRDAEDREYEIALSSVGFKVDYTGQLETLLAEQGGVWFETAKQQFSPKINFDENALEQKILECGIAEANRKEQKVIIYRDRDQGYCLYDGMQKVFDPKKVLEAAKRALESEIFFVDAAGCYADLPYTREMEETLRLWEKIDRFQNCGIVYDMGDAAILLDPQILSGFILVGEDGQFLLDEKGELMLSESGIREFIDRLCGTYDTVGKSRVFHATRGENVTVEGGTYGSILDGEAEFAYLKEALTEGRSEVHMPAYLQCGYARGAEDIGDTYIEVDMTEQKLYYYEAGELLLETDIVTGNIGRKWGTPSGVNYVYAMQKNRILRGRDYASHVKFWVPVKGNIGIHDASWRKEFGGEIYKKSGSHGCINVPPDRMEELFSYLEIGVPVVMFY